MQVFNSKYIYDLACANRRSRSISKKAESGFLYESYLNLVRTMFCELAVDRESSLLTYLCKYNGVSYAAKNFRCFQCSGIPIVYGWNQDLILLLRGLSALLRRELSDLMAGFDGFSTYLFTGMAPRDPRGPIKEEIAALLLEIDRELGKMRGTAPAQTGAQRQAFQGSLNEAYENLRAREEELDSRAEKLDSWGQKLRELQQQQNELREKLNEQQRRLNEQQRALEFQQQRGLELWDPKSSLRGELARQGEAKLREFSQARQEDDARLLDQLQKLQSDMQQGLQTIMRTREGIEYAAMQEAISQLLQLHELLWEILQYHPGGKQEDYLNLVESCKDLRENIVQSLAMLGVEQIDGAGAPYDPACHETRQGVRATREAVVRNVLKPGFQYKKKILEKAIVELW